MFAASTWICLASSYLLFAGQLSRNEMIAGLAASLVATTYAAVAHRTSDGPMHLRLRWDSVILGVAKSLAWDTIKVGVSLLRPAPGAMLQQVLPVDDRTPSGRRAVAILALSVAPNGFVVQTENAQALSHTLVPSKQPLP